jgi:5-methylcytosine-specific restriction protein A
LNQGVTSAKKQYKGKAKPALRARASDFQVRLGNLVDGLDIGPIDLAATRTTNLSAFYEAGSICSKYYVRNAIPSDDVLAADLRQFIGLYFALVSREDRLFERADAEEDERHLGEEDLRKLREHKRIERNRNLAQRAKRIQGYVCKACGFNFEAKYGALGKQFIEAHHLAPLSELKGQRVTLDPQKDFTVLCSNCHRMIHRTKLVGNIEAFSAQHVKALDKS